MSWPVKVGMGVAVLAALAVGQTIDAALPVERTDVRPFVHEAGVGDRVDLVYADLTVDAVRTAKTMTTGLDAVSTPGIWLVVDVTLVAQGRSLTKPGISLQDSRGRTFLVDPRSGYSWAPAPTGIPWQVRIPFEVPQDALAGATLVVSRNAMDDRRDDVARIDLGIGPSDVERLWDTDRTIEVPQAGMKSS
jgi:hypothetical protein